MHYVSIEFLFSYLALFRKKIWFKFFFIWHEKTGGLAAMFKNDRGRIQRLDCFNEETLRYDTCWQNMMQWQSQIKQHSLFIMNTIPFLVNFSFYFFFRMRMLALQT